MKADHNGHSGGHGGRRLKETSEASRLKSIAAHHEVSDVELRGIIVFLIGLTVMTVVVYLLMLLMFNLLNTREAEAKQTKQRSPLALSEKERLPPEPRLQSAPGFAQQLGKEVTVKEGDTAAERGKPKDRTWELDQLQKKWAEDLKQWPGESGNPAGISIEEAMKQVLGGSSLTARTPPSSQSGAGSGPEDYGVDMPTAASSGRMTEKRKQ